MLLARRTLAEWTLLTAVLAALAGAAAWQGWLWRADQVVHDLALTLYTRAPAPDITIVAIDDDSLARIGRWPWRRAVHATLLDRLTAAGARVVGFDVILNEADAQDPAGDRVLAEAIRRHGRVVLPVTQSHLGPGLLAEGLPAPVFRDAAAALGHIETELDADGIARSVYLWAGPGEARHPQLALAMLGLAAPDLAARYARDGAPPAAPATAAWHRSAWLHLPFAGPPGTYRTVSYVDVLTGDVPAAALKGQLVLVGATAVGLGDTYPTPMSGLGRSMPGVEIHANVLDALRQGMDVQWLSGATLARLAMVTALVLMLAQLYLSPRDALVFSAAVGLAAMAGAMALLDLARVWLPPGALLVAAALSYPLWSWRRLEATQRFMDDELQALRGDASGDAPSGSIDPLENRIAIVRTAARRQRALRQTREDTMRFVSHDLRSPLASIVTLAEGPSPDEPDCRRRLHEAGRYAQIALDLADDFFRLARAEAADPRGFVEVELPALAMEAADEVWVLADAKGIHILVHDETTGQPCVRGDAALLRRALVNLLGNAVKYSPGGSTVRLVVRDGPGGTLETAVIDQGCGITPENAERLFQPFTRLANPDGPRQTGVGLGLVIVKTITERHGGSVAMASEPGRGSTFRIILPRAPAA